jgi:hypothetical protein
MISTGNLPDVATRALAILPAESYISEAGESVEGNDECGLGMCLCLFFEGVFNM